MVCALLFGSPEQQDLETACTGTLITPSKIVTAAHCFNPNVAYVSCDPNLSGQPTTHKIQGFDIFPYWDLNDIKEAREDIAVLTLEADIEGASTAALPSQEFLMDLYRSGEAA